MTIDDDPVQLERHPDHLERCLWDFSLVDIQTLLRFGNFIWAESRRRAALLTDSDTLLTFGIRCSSAAAAIRATH